MALGHLLQKSNMFIPQLFGPSPNVNLNRLCPFQELGRVTLEPLQGTLSCECCIGPLPLNHKLTPRLASFGHYRSICFPRKNDLLAASDSCKVLSPSL